jgi:hypothetical protein
MVVSKPAAYFGFTLKQLPFEIGQIWRIMSSLDCLFVKLLTGNCSVHYTEMVIK